MLNIKLSPKFWMVVFSVFVLVRIHNFDYNIKENKQQLLTSLSISINLIKKYIKFAPFWFVHHVTFLLTHFYYKWFIFL